MDWETSSPEMSLTPIQPTVPPDMDTATNSPCPSLDLGSPESNPPHSPSVPPDTSSPCPSLSIGQVFDVLPRIKTGVYFKEHLCLLFCVGLVCTALVLCCPIWKLFLCLVTTPNINSSLAGPFKKKPVESSSEFRAIWTESKAYVNNVSGKGQGGSYKERKDLRRSEEFQWPISPGHQGGV